jgi:hypothetical protein
MSVHLSSRARGRWAAVTAASLAAAAIVAGPASARFDPTDAKLNCEQAPDACKVASVGQTAKLTSRALASSARPARCQDWTVERYGK